MKILACYLLAASIVDFVLFGMDKRRAKRNLWRIPERILLLAAVLGGSPGGLAGMYFFHHKTRKPKFYIGVPLILALQILLVLLASQRGMLL